MKKSFLATAILAMAMLVAWTGLATAEPQVDNLVPNNSVEETGTAGSPESWLTDQWGSNDASFEYLPTGYTGTRSVRVEITDYSSGDAKWHFTFQPVTAGAYYRFSDYYISDVITHVVVALRDGSGTTRYVPLKDAPVSNIWTKYEDGVTIPAGTVSASVYHVLAKPGYLITDEFSFHEAPVPAPFARGIVSITFDDGYATDYDTALPLLQKHGLHATHYVFTDGVGDTANGYMTADQIVALAAAGEEIGSHAVTHTRLTQLEPSQVALELASSKSILESILATQVPSFALPYGEFDAQVTEQVRDHYRSSRTTISGYNTPYNIDPYRIVVMPLDSATSLSEVRTWVDTAKQENYWLVLMYHAIDDSGGSAVRAEDLDAALAYIKASGVAVKTVGEALDEVGPQPEPVSVPDVVGSTEASASATITAAGLAVGTVTEAYHATVPAGEVISQDPAAGTLVPPASEVDLVVSKGPEPVSVPDVVGSTEATASATITSAGLAVGTVTEAYHATVPAGEVISQDPAAGTLVPPASEIDLVVSKGPEPVSVPDVVGSTEASATATITSAGLAVGTVTEVYHATVPAGEVISQDPAAGTLVPPASEVDLVVSKGPEPVSVPDVVGSTEASASATITAAGLAVGTVTEAYHATVPAGEVISQDPAGGTLVPPASEIDLVVSKGPEPVSVPAAVSLARTSPSKTLSKYGQTYYFTGKLTSAGVSLAGKRVYLKQASSLGGRYSFSGRYATTRSDGTFTIAIVARDRTFYRAYFGGAQDEYKAAYSSVASVMPRAYVSNPRAPRSMRSTKRYTVYGYLKPRHTASTYPVRIYRWKKTSSGKWKKHGYVKAKAYDYGSYTKYKVKMRLSKKGTWRLRAYAPADSKHAAAWSSSYDYVKVK